MAFIKRDFQKSTKLLVQMSTTFASKSTASMSSMSSMSSKGVPSFEPSFELEDPNEIASMLPAEAAVEYMDCARNKYLGDYPAICSSPKQVAVATPKFIKSIEVVKDWEAIAFEIFDSFEPKYDLSEGDVWEAESMAISMLFENAESDEKSIYIAGRLLDLVAAAKNALAQALVDEVWGAA